MDRDYYGPIGRVVNKDNQGVWIKTVDGFLIVKKAIEIDTDNQVDLCDLLPLGFRFK